MAFLLFHYIQKQKTEKLAMGNKIQRKIQVSLRNGEIWNIKVGYFKPTLLLTRYIPTDPIYMNLKIVLN